MACASPAYLSGTHWFLFVAVISFIATIIWIFIYLLSVREALKLPINWILTVRQTHHVKGELSVVGRISERTGLDSDVTAVLCVTGVAEHKRDHSALPDRIHRAAVDSFAALLSIHQGSQHRCRGNRLLTLSNKGICARRHFPNSCFPICARVLKKFIN